MISFDRTTHYLSVVRLVSVAVLCLPAQSAAQVFVNPFVGYNFGGDSGCPEITGCDEKNLTGA